MALDTIELFIEDSEDDGIQAISFVKDPAIEENWIALSKQTVAFKSIDDEKRIVVGIGLKPNMEIFRRKGDYEFNVIFSAETVKKASHLYLKSLNSNNATLEHEKDATGLSVVESWIVEDVANDKANGVYNLGAELGDWCVMMGVDNDEVWKEVKDGTYLGFSIEGAFSDRKIEASKQDEVMTEERAEELLLIPTEELTEEQAKEILDLIAVSLK
jgi:hypothetical protein